VRVLVAYGTKMGGTAGLAEMIAESLRRRGIEVEVRAAGPTVDPTPFDAVIVGGALYALRWHKHARRFVKRNASALLSKPVWLFSSGPLDDSAQESEIPPTKQVEGLMRLVDALGHVTFGGRLPADATGFPAKAMAKENAGDWRDPEHVDAWVSHVSEHLTRTAAHR